MFHHLQCIVAYYLIISKLKMHHARLEGVYTPKGYPEFESRSLRKINSWKSIRCKFISKSLLYLLGNFIAF